MSAQRCFQKIKTPIKSLCVTRILDQGASPSQAGGMTMKAGRENLHPLSQSDMSQINCRAPRPHNRPALAGGGSNLPIRYGENPGRYGTCRQGD
jgi:hypothetical protein